MLCLSGFELYSRWVPLRDKKKIALRAASSLESTTRER